MQEWSCRLRPCDPKELVSYDAGYYWIRISIFIKLCQLQLAVFSNKFIFSQLYLMLNGVDSDIKLALFDDILGNAMV